MRVYLLDIICKPVVALVDEAFAPSGAISKNFIAGIHKKNV